MSYQKIASMKETLKLKTLMKLIVFLLIIVGVIGCSKVTKTETNNLDEFTWLTGEWMDSSSSGKMVEIWNQINDSLLVGSSIYLAGIDTIFYEEISLKKIKNDIYYIPSIQSEEGALPVLFKYTGYKNDEWIFENKDHDFPQRIVYTHPEPDSLIAYVDGNKNGEYRKEFFRMKKIN